jgi:hypothetical protein
MSGHWQKVENERSSDMAGESGWMGVFGSSDKAGYELRMSI